MHTTALVCTAILGILVFGLGLAVSTLRFRERRSFGYVQDPANLLHKMIRAHGNATEYAPFLAVLILYLGAQEPSAITVGLMIGATASRAAHAIGMVAWPAISRPNPFRFAGALGTYVCGFGLCLSLVWPG